MTDPNRPSRPGARPGTELFAAAAAIAAGTAAYADVVRFDNPEGPGQFFWPFNVLDVTLSADTQPGFAGLGGPTTSYQSYFSDFYPAFTYYTTYQTNGGMDIFSQGFADRYAAPLDANTMVGGDLNSLGSFINSTVFEFEFTACDIEIYYLGPYYQKVYSEKCMCFYQYGPYYYGPYYSKTCDGGNRGILPDGTETFLGVSFDAGSGTQYGWVNVRRNFVEIEALAWGFETEPGKPIRAGATCDGDLDNDGEIGFTDLTTLLGNWGQNGPGAELTLPWDQVDFTDLTALLAKWGPCPVRKLAGAAPPQGTLAALAFGSAPRS